MKGSCEILVSRSSICFNWTLHSTFYHFYFKITRTAAWQAYNIKTLHFLSQCTFFIFVVYVCLNFSKVLITTNILNCFLHACPNSIISNTWSEYTSWITFKFECQMEETYDIHLKLQWSMIRMGPPRNLKVLLNGAWQCSNVVP